ncbi:ABC transporter permease [Clostridium sp. DL1XJH146]
MRKYFNKALVYKEIKTSLLPLIFGGIFIIYFFSFRFISMINNYESSSDRYFYDYFFYTDFTNENGGAFVLIVLAIVYSTWIIGKDRLNRRQELISTMPFTRTQILISKISTTLAGVIIPSIISIIIMNLYLILNKGMIPKNSEVFYNYNRWMLLCVLVGVFTVTFISFIQYLCGKAYIGGLLGSIFLIVPMGLSATLWIYIDYFFRSIDRTGVLHENNFWSKLDSIIMEFAMKISPIFYSFDYTYMDVYTPIFTGTARAITLSILSLIFIALSIYVYNKWDFERIGQISMFKSFEAILKFGVSFCFMIVLTIAIVGIRYDEEPSFMLFSILSVGIFAGFYYASTKLINNFKK